METGLTPITDPGHDDVVLMLIVYLYIFSLRFLSLRPVVLSLREAFMNVAFGEELSWGMIMRRGLDRCEWLRSVLLL